MNHVEIARVQLRKIEQQTQDSLTELARTLGPLLGEKMIAGLAAGVFEHTLVAGKSYNVAATQGEQGAVVTSTTQAPDLLLRFLGRTPLPPLGGFAADVFTRSDRAWQRVVGPADWLPAQWEALAELLDDAGDEREGESR